MRSSGTKPMPARTASRGPRMAQRRTVAAADAPDVGRSAPTMARSVSLRPEPTRPARPRISPRRTSKLTSRGRRPPRQALDAQRDRGRSRRGACSTGVQRRPRPPSAGPSRRSTRASASRSPTTRPSRSTVMRSAEAADLLDPVADVEDRRARRGEAAQVRERLRDLGVGERRGRLVEDQHAAGMGERRGHLDELLLADAERAGRQVRIEGLEADRPQRRRAPARAAPRSRRPRRDAAGRRGTGSRRR